MDLPSSIHLANSDIRRRLEESEGRLSPYAAKSQLTRGRMRSEALCPMRTEFQRDRDRIIHTKSFRRLMHKTQVFIAPAGDHYRTRLTHTLEVSQIARSITRALNLNEDLTEAISLGHDLGHTPFGHMGEDILNELYSEGFRHNEQSLRVVDVLEKDGQGLNLTWEVRDGILNHSKNWTDILDEGGGIASTLEGQICRVADAVAYINHDIDDAIRAGIITESALPADVSRLLGSTNRERINSLIIEIVSFALKTEGESGKIPQIGMSPLVRESANKLRQFLLKRVYGIAREEAEQAQEVVRALFQYFTKNAEKLPDEYRLVHGGIERSVVDYISGMTDRYAMETFREVCSTR
jgi:dGTPase